MEWIFFGWDSKLAIQFQNFNATENVESYKSTIFETKWNHMKSTEIMVQKHFPTKPETSDKI